MKLSLSSVAAALRKARWHNDFRQQGWEIRSAEFEAASVQEHFNPGTKVRNFRATYYTGNPAQYWKGEDFDSLRDAVTYLNNHLDDAQEKYQGDLSKQANVAERYIRACFINSFPNVPGVGSVVTKVEYDGHSVRMNTSDGGHLWFHVEDRGFEQQTEGDEESLAETVANRSQEKVARAYADDAPQPWFKEAAQVGTDTATIWAIAPESLAHLVANPKFVEEMTGDLGENMDKLEKIWNQHGGAWFHTGGDGSYDVKIPTKEGFLPIVKEKGYTKPYGSKGYDPDKL